MALDLLFRDDAQDGTLEQLALCGLPLAGLVLAKRVVHWCLTGLPWWLVGPMAVDRARGAYRAIPGILAPCCSARSR